ESRRISRTLQLEFWLIHAARNVSGQHKEEIDALGGVGGSPSCRCHQRGNHEGSQSAHYVDTVLHCEQPGWLSPQLRVENLRRSHVPRQSLLRLQRRVQADQTS